MKATAPRSSAAATASGSSAPERTMLATPGALAQELEAPEAVHSRHPEVEQDDVGRRAGDEWQELMAAERLAHDLDIALARERRSDRCQHQMMIVSDQELEPHFNLPASSASPIGRK